MFKPLKKILYTCIIVATMFIVTACQGNSKESSSKENENTQNETNTDDYSEEALNPLLQEVILTVDNEDVRFSEVMLYFKYIESHYESIFGNHIWDYDLGGMTIEDLAKQDIIDTIVERKITKKQWQDYDIAITEEDELNINEDVEKYLEKITQEDIDDYGLNQEVVYQFYFDNMMSERVYDAATMNVDTDVSDEEAKQITIQYILVSTTKVDSSGNAVPVSTEEKQNAYIKAQDLLSQAKETEDFYSFAKSNTDAANIEVVMGYGDMPKAFEDAAFALKTGEMSEIIEGENGYFILYCLDDFNEDATLEKKEEIIDERQSQVFKDLYNEWQKEVKVELNKKVWDSIQFERNE